jgi:hypothetical protein
MNSTGGYVYFLNGANQFGRDEAVRALKERVRALPAGEHNLTELDGPAATVRALRESADAMPFLTDRRYVILHGLLDRLLGGKSPTNRARRASKRAAVSASSELEELQEYLPQLPATASVAFVDGDRLDVEPLAKLA